MFVFFILLIFIETLSLIFLPLTVKLFPDLKDHGYAFSKSLTVVILSFVSWYLISLKLIPFNQVSLILVILILLIIFVGLAKPQKPKIVRNDFLIFLFGDFLFFAVFAFTSYLKFFTSPIAGTEKPMDFAFINGILRSTYFPPQDPWFAGHTINYYYFGHYFIAYLAKILAIPSSIIYTFALPLVFSLTAINIYGVIVNAQPFRKKRFVFLIAVLSVILVLFSGNLDLLVKTFTNLFSQGHMIINWWDPSRVIGRGFLKDSYITITEFPYFSLLLGDVHAHVLNLLFGSLFIGLCLCFYFDLQKSVKITAFTLARLFMVAIIFAIIGMSNPWDLPGYSLLLLLLFLKSFSVSHFRFNVKLLLSVLIVPVFLVSLAPFLIHFDMIRPINDPKPFLVLINDITLIGRRTLFGEFLNVWGIHLAILLFALFVLAISKKLRLTEITIPLALIFVGASLVVFCEFFYINDFFLPPNERMNTVFKFYYQVWLILGIGVPLVLLHAIDILKPLFKKISFVIAILLLAGSLNYLIIATPLRLTEFASSQASIDGLNFMSFLPDTSSDLKAINWLAAHEPSQANLLESAIDPQGGNSYSRLGRISAATGLPTLIGWSALNHEGGWRNSSPDIALRISDTARLYNTEDLVQASLLIQKYHLKYIYYGSIEKEAYPYADLNKFSVLGHLVYSEGVSIYQIN